MGELGGWTSRSQSNSDPEHREQGTLNGGGRPGIFFKISPSDAQSVVRQRSLKRFRFMPWHAQPSVPFLLRRPYHRHSFWIYRFNVRICGRRGKAVDLLSASAPEPRPFFGIRRCERELVCCLQLNSRVQCPGQGSGGELLWTYPSSSLSKTTLQFRSSLKKLLGMEVSTRPSSHLARRP